MRPNSTQMQPNIRFVMQACFEDYFNYVNKMISIYKFGLSVCLSVCLYPINVKMAEPIGPNFLWDI